MDLSKYTKHNEIRTNAGKCPNCGKDAYICTGMGRQGSEWVCTACDFMYPTKVEKKVEVKKKVKKTK